MRKNAGERTAMDYALRILSRRAVSSGTLRDLLSRKGYPRTESEPCIEKLREWGYLDDQGYARNVLHALSSEYPVGRIRAAFELRRRAVDPELAAAAIDEAYRDVSEEALASEAARKYLSGRSKGSLKQKEREKLARWLQRRGFGYESIRSALSGLGQSNPG